jgi:hypothetical protein
MKKNSFKRNEKAQVLGLPMYLIIIMIVAVAVIAAVIFMMPQGSQMMDARIKTGSAQASSSTDADNNAVFSTFTVTVKVTTKGEYNEPIKEATVRISGYGGIGEGETNSNGEATFTVSGCELPSGINSGNLKMTVKAEGYEDFEDDTAVELVR